MPGSGRASHRGGARGDQRPGDVNAATQQMASMSLARDRRQPFTEPRTRPEHITDKTGKPMQTNDQPDH